MRPSKTVPTNVNSVRPADIKLVMALGDSLTAANGAGAEDAVAVFLQYRGLAFQAGGDGTLDNHITIPNILKKYNPKLFGYSVGIGSPNVWEISYLNVAVPGAIAADLPGQARTLVSLLHNHPETLQPSECVQHIQDAIQIIYDNVPRVIVSVTAMLQLEILRQSDKGRPWCKDLHKCARHRTPIIHQFQDGQVNREFFAPDCFHFSQWGHALVSSWLWKNILEPVGAKTTKGSADEPSLPLACPDPACPFIRTNANSKDCSEYLTPTAGN
ncbi:GDSL-like protein [Ancylostoma ceylanicum]|uniref:GDSL-like protein n=1 Tax=Ancylostoma ceylanicum TaxID=53326 RepID=A0A0D6LKQ9_9BILA|nr:GDSL-like protein [Ancylostoma ceylanicum]